MPLDGRIVNFLALSYNTAVFRQDEEELHKFSQILPKLDINDRNAIESAALAELPTEQEFEAARLAFRQAESEILGVTNN